MAANKNMHAYYIAHVEIYLRISVRKMLPSSKPWIRYGITSPIVVNVRASQPFWTS